MVGRIQTIALICALVVASQLAAWGQALSDSPEAQALISQALSLWEQSKRTPGVQNTDEQAGRLLERVVAEYPGTEQAAEALRHLGFGYAWKGLPDQSEAAYEKLFKEYPTSKARERAWLDRAMFVANRGRFDKSLEYCQLALANFPKGEAVANTLYDLGQYCCFLCRWQEALGWFDQVRQKHPDTEWGRKGELQAASVRLSPLRDYDGAIAAFDRIIANRTDALTVANAILNRAEAFLGKKQPQEALSALAQLGADPRLNVTDRPWLPAAGILTGKAMAAAGDAAGAAEVLRKLAVDYPGTLEAGNARLAAAAALRARGQFVEAAAEYRLLLITPGHPWTRASAALKLGDTLRDLKLFDQAIEAYEQVQPLQPDSRGLCNAARIGIDHAREERAAPSTGPRQTTTRLLSPQELGETVGGITGNDQRCDDRLDGCGSLCIEGQWDIYGIIYYSRRALEMAYSNCRPKYWYEGSSTCIEGVVVPCAQWRYYTWDWNCEGLPFDGDELYTYACAP